MQRRLTALALDITEDEPGTYGPATEEAVRTFQRRRGLRVDGICGRQTWSTLVQASYRLGDRLLFHRLPPLRGDDVADLQRRLGTLGFDPGKIDGAFGSQTAQALSEFQRNVGLPVDGVCGPATLQALARLGSRCSGPVPVPAVRELESLRSAPRTLAGRRILLGDGGGSHALTTALARNLSAAGALALTTQHPDQSEQAQEANQLGAEVYLGLRLEPEMEGCTAAYYAGHHYESPAGRRLATLIQECVPPALGLRDCGTCGMAVPVLLETRMPAVVCELGPPAYVVERTADVARALAEALHRWTTEPGV